MKKLFKKLAGLMMGLLAVAGLAGLGANSEAPVKAEAATIPTSTTFYLTPSAYWNQSNARFAIYFFGNGDAWVSMTKVAGENNLWVGTSPSTKTFTNLIFVRMNPGNQTNSWDSNSKWNQTSDLVYDGINNWYTVKENTWDNGGGTWSAYGVTEVEKFTVTYYDGENVIDTKEQVTHFAPITPNPKDGFVVEGWYKDADLKTAIAEGDPITADTNVYVKWEKAVAVYAYNTNNWTTVNCYLWGSTFNFIDAWPGATMTKIGDSKLYYYEIGESKAALVTGGIINNGSSQTVDITISGGVANKCLVLKTTQTSGKYNASVVSTLSTVAHIAGETIPAYNGLGDTGLVAADSGVSVVKLTKNGFAFDAEATAALTAEEKQAAFEAYMSSVDTCADFANVDAYTELAAGLDTSVTISDNGGEVTIADKLAYMATLNSTDEAPVESNLLSNITSTNNIAIVLIVGLLGLTAVGAYYFLNKKKFAK